MNKLQVKDISVDRFNPYEASAQELLAIALYDYGLLNESTMIDDAPANYFLESFFKKRQAFKDATLLGNILLARKKISNEELAAALKLQSRDKAKMLGQILVIQGCCSQEDVNTCLEAQRRRRSDVQERDDSEDSL